MVQIWKESVISDAQIGTTVELKKVLSRFGEKDGMKLQMYF